MVGNKFGRLTVVNQLGRYKNREIIWECICECGNRRNIRTSKLTTGHTKSCGCLHKDITSARSTTHGLCHTRLYNIWDSMMQRCTNPNNINYKHYGNRGIKVCEEWRDPVKFISWSMGNGYADYLEIDRIDNNGNYCPENCRWTDRITQLNNTRKNSYLTVNGETKTLSQWSREKKISRSTLFYRIKRGITGDELFLTAINKNQGGP